MVAYYHLDCSDSEFVELSEGNDWEGIVCPKNDGHRRPGRRTTILHIDIVSKRPVDFSSTILSDIIITDSALRVLNAAKLTGFRVAPVVVHALPNGMDQTAVPQLWEFLIIGDGGLSHPDSRIKLKYKCDACGLVRYSAYEHGIVVDEHASDGSVFFVVKEYPTHALVNERARTVIANSGLTGMRFIESSKLEWPKSVIKP